MEECVLSQLLSVPCLTVEYSVKEVSVSSVELTSKKEKK